MTTPPPHSRRSDDDAASGTARDRLARLLHALHELDVALEVAARRDDTAGDVADAVNGSASGAAGRAVTG